MSGHTKDTKEGTMQTITCYYIVKFERDKKDIKSTMIRANAYFMNFSAFLKLKYSKLMSHLKAAGRVCQG